MEDTIELNFVNTPISHLTKLISELTGNNLVSEGDIPGNFTFVSQRPIRKKNLMAIYEMILRTKGYMIVNHEDKDFFMIRRNNAPQSENLEFGLKSNNYEIKTELINLSYFRPSGILKIIQPYFSPTGKVVANDELGFLMLTDYHDNINKIKDIIRRVDKQKDIELKWVKLHHVNVKNVFAQIQTLTAKIAQKYRKPIEVIEDRTTNTIIVSASGNDHREVIDLIEKMDRDGMSNIRSDVIYLKNSTSAEIVKIIQNMEKTRYEQGSIKDKERASIAHDVSLNAIIIMGEPEITTTYRSIIEDLDKPKKQVFVKAHIVEVSETKAKNVGIELDNLLAGDVAKSGAWSVAGNINQSGFPALSLLSATTGAALSEVENGISIGVFLNFLQTQGIAKFVSSPTILCLDNQESSIYVGQNQPIRTSQSQQSNTTDVPVTTFQYKDIGLTLTVKPQIMEDDKVRLDISNRIEEVIRGSEDQLPTTTKREIKNTSIVNNGEDIVIAGLIRNVRDRAETRIPLLGDLPFIGNIFRNEEENADRVNLLIVLTPRVVKDPDNLQEESDRYKYEFEQDNKTFESDDPEFKSFLER